MARKREERAAKSAYKKEKKAKNAGIKEEEQNFVGLNNQLATMGFELREVPGDGNCLFRALGDQLDGHSRNHIKHREDTVEFMRQFRKDFEPFVEDDVPFDSHVQNLQKVGTYAGNDAIVAFARRHGVTVVIHQLNSPLWKIHGGDHTKPQRELHIAYHNGDHYNSVRRIGDNSQTPAKIRIDDTAAATATSKNLRPVYEGNQTEESSSSDEDDMASLDAVQIIMNRSGCQDPLLVEQTLQQHQYNVDATVDFLINMTILSSTAEGNNLWTEDGTGTRLFGKLERKSPPIKTYEGGVKQKQIKFTSSAERKHLSNKQRKEMKRRERKINSQLKKKKDLTSNSNSDSDSEINVTHVVQHFGSLNI